jgi:hypothetical protein
MVLLAVGTRLVRLTRVDRLRRDTSIREKVSAIVSDVLAEAGGVISGKSVDFRWGEE